MILRFNDGFVKDNSLYFSASNINGLFCCDLSTCSSRYIGNFDDSEYFTSDLHIKTIFYDDNLYFIPFRAKKLTIYNTENGKIKNIDLPRVHSGYINAYIYENTLIMMPYRLSDRVLYFDLKREEFYDKKELTDNILSCLGDKDYYSDLFGTCFKEKKAFIALYGTSKILSLDLEDNKCKEYNLSVKSIYNIECTLRGLYLVCNDYSELYFWDEESGLLNKIDVGWKDNYIYKIYKREISGTDESIFIINGAEVTKVINNKDEKVIYKISEQSGMISKTAPFMGTVVSENGTYLCPSENGIVLCIDDTKVTEFSIDFNIGMINRDRGLQSEMALFSEGLFSLRDFIAII